VELAIRKGERRAEGGRGTLVEEDGEWKARGWLGEARRGGLGGCAG